MPRTLTEQTQHHDPVITSPHYPQQTFSPVFFNACRQRKIHSIPSTRVFYMLRYKQNDTTQNKPTLLMWLVFGGKIQLDWLIQSHSVHALLTTIMQCTTLILIPNIPQTFLWLFMTVADHMEIFYWVSSTKFSFFILVIDRDIQTWQTDSKTGECVSIITLTVMLSSASLGTRRGWLRRKMSFPRHCINLTNWVILGQTAIRKVPNNLGALGP